MMLRSVQQHLGPRDGGSSRCRAVHASSTGEAAVLDVFDPHFHLFDPVGVHNGKRSDGSSFVAYHQPDYEQDMARMPAGFRHVGGCWVEAMSVCFTSLDAPALQQHCVSEAAFVETELKRSSLEYVLCASACLEDPSVSETLQQLVKSHPGMRAIRQIANVSPDWPRNGRLGNLVRQAQWRAGYEQLARFGLGFDLQCNPWQLESYVEEVVAPNPAVPCVLNHLGLPLLAELSTPDRAAVYWKGMDALAQCPHAFLQISMLYYIDQDWDKNLTVIEAVLRLIRMFGVERCFFASNYPVDIQKGWPAHRLFPALRRLCDKGGISLGEQRQLFAGTARRAYRV